QGPERETVSLLIKKTFEDWQTKLKAQKIVRLSFPLLHSFLDPRLGGSVGNGHYFILRMMFDGLTRIGADGKPYLSIAESVNISSDQKYYLFKLRKCSWSNGAPVTAYDFEYTWKSILSPSFKTSSSYLFYPIMHAKAAKEGLVPLENVKIRAIDESTLAVELAFPAPYFLELIANPLFSPVNHQIDQIHPDWAAQEAESYICNGPFHLTKRHSFDRYVLKKNPTYWDADNVKLDQITIYKTNNVHEVLEMFQKDQIDYLGRPMQPWEPFFAHQTPEIDPTPRIYWLTFNVQSFPFNHPKLRKALALAINRQEIVSALSGDMIPATTPLPREHTYHLHTANYEENAGKARVLFDEALEELGLNRNSFSMPPILSFQGFLRETTALIIKRQWEQCFDIHCRVEAHNLTTLFERMYRGDYQISGMGWEPLVNDPIYTLDAFKNAKEKVNFSKWEHEDFQMLLDAANEECDLKKRDEYLLQAEKILIDQLPVIPLYYEVGKFMKKENLYVPGIGWQMDFKHA
ncbi:MAG TPA: peptide ABC transporter substrate-binding protein, partial [Rhabdochlamydiaceae bacterium]